MSIEEDTTIGCKIPRTQEIIHKLRTDPDEFRAVLACRCTHSIRRNDRCFQEGDRVLLQEWIPATGLYTGSEVLCLITYVTPGGKWGIPADRCVLSIRIERWALPNIDAITD